MVTSRARLLLPLCIDSHAKYYIAIDCRNFAGDIPTIAAIIIITGSNVDGSAAARALLPLPFKAACMVGMAASTLPTTQPMSSRAVHMNTTLGACMDEGHKELNLAADQLPL